MSSPAANILGDLTQPGLHFEPLDDEIVQLYLLPRVRGHLDLFPGLIIDDDTAANTQPWTLFGRHGLPDEDGAQAFFFVHGGARPDRRCQGGGTWKSQKDLAHEMVVDGETVKWSRHNLNFHMGTGGSWGWVMHEYTIAGSSSLKLCSISFSGHGHKRKRVPDDESATQRPRVAAEESGSGTTTFEFDQGFSTAHASSDEEIAAEMTYEQPTWVFQEQLQHTTNASAPQEFQPSPPSTTMSSQDSGLPQEPWEIMSEDDITKVLDMISQVPADGEPYQQSDEQAPVMDQSSCSAPNIGNTDAGIDFTFSYDDV